MTNDDTQSPEVTSEVTDTPPFSTTIEDAPPFVPEPAAEATVEASAATKRKGTRKKVVAVEPVASVPEIKPVTASVPDPEQPDQVYDLNSGLSPATQREMEAGRRALEKNRR